MVTLDANKRYMIEGEVKVAWYCIGYVEVKDEDFEWTGIITYDESRVVCVMVGDDREFNFDIEDLIPIADEDYCSECGQIGCTADGR